MAEYHVGCGPFGNVYVWTYAPPHKDGLQAWRSVKEVTREAIEAVVNHFIIKMEHDGKNKIQKALEVRGGKTLKVTFELFPPHPPARRYKMNKRRNRPSSGKQAMSANLRKIARQNQLYGFHMALDGIAATWGALIQNLRCDADLTDEQVQKIIRIGDRYWEMVGKFKEEDMTPDEFADYITAKSEQVEKELRERWS